MERKQKKEVVERMAESFMSITDLEGKSMAIMCMSAYAEGKAAGKAEERAKWENRAAVNAQRQQEMPCRMRQGVNITEVQA